MGTPPVYDGPRARWVLASANPGKRREFAALLSPHGIELTLQSELGIDSIEETGATFEDNALLKARHAAARSGLPALADDSGIEVAALGNRPGVYSARYAGPDADDAANNRRLLEELAGIEPARRTARYRCVLALIEPPTPVPTPVAGAQASAASAQALAAGAERFGSPGGESLASGESLAGGESLASGEWAGRIAAAPAGSSGFGYDVIFIPDGYAVTAAQMPVELKNRLSHRAAALAELLRRLPPVRM